MKVLLINGSPHEKGCTYTALCEVANTLNEEGFETEIFHIGNKVIAGCVGCGNCAKTGKCVINDIVNDCLQKCDEADGFVFGSPVYFASANGTMTAFMDRLFYSGRTDTRFYLKPAAAVVSARRAGTTATIDQMNKYFAISQMPIVSSKYWNIVHGSNADEVRQDGEGMQTMRILARNMAYLLRCKEAGCKANVPLPKKEKPQKTNFIR